MEDDGPPGVPEWVVTYGDMMSLLLTFFIMLVSLSEVVADKKYQAIMEALMTYTGYETGPKAPEGKNFPLTGLVEKLETLGSFSKNDTGRGGLRFQAVPGNETLLKRNKEGIPQEVGKPILFAPGSAELTDVAKQQIAEIAAEVRGYGNKIEILGHAKAAPASAPSASASQDDSQATRTASRFAAEYLSFRRAKAVRDELIRVQKIKEERRFRIRAIGAAEPIPESGDQRVAQQDRVQVRILDVHWQTLQGPRDDGN